MIYIKINNDNVVIDVSNEYNDGYIEVPNEEWPFDIFNDKGDYCYKYFDGNLLWRNEDEIYGPKILPIDDVSIEEEDDMTPSIEARVSAIENAFSILLDGV